MQYFSRHLAVAALAVAMGFPTCGAAAQTRVEGVTPSALASLRDIDVVSVSPDGRWAAFVVRQGDPGSNTYDQDWIVLSLESGATRRIADAGDPVFLDSLGFTPGVFTPLKAVWTPDSQSILYLRRHNERVEIWRSEIETGESRLVRAFEGDVETFTADTGGETASVRVAPDPHVAAAELQREGESGFLLDRRFVPSFSISPLLPADRLRDPRSGLPTAPGYEASRGAYTLDLQTFAVTPAQSPPPSASPANARGRSAERPDGHRAWFEARDPRFQGGMPPLTVMADVGPERAPVACEHTECTGILFPGLFWNGEEVLFARREGASFTEHVLYGWNPANGSLRTVYSPERGTPDWACGQTPHDLICRFDEPLRPTRLIAIELATGVTRTLFDPNPEFEGLEASFVVRRIDALTSGGVPTFGYLVKRSDLAEQALPLVVVTYRCNGFLRGGTGDEYPILPLASEGFAALCWSVPDSDYERFAVQTYGEYAREQREGNLEKIRVHAGLEAIVQEVVRRGDADPRRIAVTGLSFGAETTNYALFNMPNLTAAIASSAAMAPGNVFLSGAGWHAYEGWGLADPNTQRWRDLSVVHNTQHVRTPLLLNLADHEMLGAMEVYVALDRAGRSVEAFVYPDEYHIKWQPAHRLAVYNRNIDWLSFWLRGGEEGRTSDPGQYARWRTLRNGQCRLFGPDGTERQARARGHEAMTDAELTPWYCAD